MGGIPSAIIDVGSFNSTDGSLGPSEGSNEGNVGMPLVLRSVSIGEAQAGRQAFSRACPCS